MVLGRVNHRLTENNYVERNFPKMAISSFILKHILTAHFSSYKKQNANRSSVLILMDWAQFWIYELNVISWRKRKPCLLNHQQRLNARMTTLDFRKSFVRKCFKHWFIVCESIAMDIRWGRDNYQKCRNRKWAPIFPEKNLTKLKKLSVCENHLLRRKNEFSDKNSPIHMC